MSKALAISVASPLDSQQISLYRVLFFLKFSAFGNAQQAKEVFFFSIVLENKIPALWLVGSQSSLEQPKAW